MSRHIDADRASLNLEINFTEEEKEQKKLSIIDLITYIGEQPTVDAVEVVRCKDCKWGKETCGNIECFVDLNAPSEYHGYDWYCPNGEKVSE